MPKVVSIVPTQLAQGLSHIAGSNGIKVILLPIQTPPDGPLYEDIETLQRDYSFAWFERAEDAYIVLSKTAWQDGSFDSPAELVWAYRDKHRQWQGPFALLRLLNWNATRPDLLPDNFWVQHCRSHVWLQMENVTALIRAIKHLPVTVAAPQHVREQEDVVMLEPQDVVTIIQNLRDSLQAEQECKMDLDMHLPEPMDWCNSVEMALRVLLVVDTNVLIDNWGVLQRLRATLSSDKQQSDCSVQASMLIPHIVLCELDKLKQLDSNSVKSAAVAKAARETIQLLHEAIDAHSQFFTGQSLADYDKAAQTADGMSKSNDDRILQCCLYYQTQLDKQEDPDTKSLVVLLTNDKNLQLKAKVNHVCTAVVSDIDANALLKLAGVSLPPCPDARDKRAEDEDESSPREHTALDEIGAAEKLFGQDLIWYYVGDDAQKSLQGPFKASMMLTWFKGNHLPKHLLVVPLTPDRTRDDLPTSTFYVLQNLLDGLRGKGSARPVSMAQARLMAGKPSQNNFAAMNAPHRHAADMRPPMPAVRTRHENAAVHANNVPLQAGFQAPSASPFEDADSNAAFAPQSQFLKDAMAQMGATLDRSWTEHSSLNSPNALAAQLAAQLQTSVAQSQMNPSASHSMNAGQINAALNQMNHPNPALNAMNNAAVNQLNSNAAMPAMNPAHFAHLAGQMQRQSMQMQDAAGMPAGTRAPPGLPVPGPGGDFSNLAPNLAHAAALAAQHDPYAAIRMANAMNGQHAANAQNELFMQNEQFMRGAAAMQMRGYGADMAAGMSPMHGHAQAGMGMAGASPRQRQAPQRRQPQWSPDDVWASALDCLRPLALLMQWHAQRNVGEFWEDMAVEPLPWDTEKKMVHLLNKHFSAWLADCTQFSVSRSIQRVDQMTRRARGREPITIEQAMDMVALVHAIVEGLVVNSRKPDLKSLNEVPDPVDYNKAMEQGAAAFAQINMLRQELLA